MSIRRDAVRTARYATMLLLQMATACQQDLPRLFSLANPNRATDAGVGGNLALGENLVGEPCRAVAQRLPRGQTEEIRSWEIFCGAWERPSGTLAGLTLPQALPADRAERQSAIDRLARESRSARELALRATCQPGQWVAEASGRDFLLVSCTLNAGNWPYVALAVEADGAVYHGHGIPAVLPVLLAAAQRLNAPAGQTADAPKAPTDANDRQAMIRRLEQSLGGSSGLYGGDDIGAFQDLTELARLYNGFENYAGAERAYRRALDIQKRLLGVDNPGIGDTLMRLALEVSNQGRVDEADALFREADPLVQRSVDPAQYARLVSTLALHSANQRQFQRSLGQAREATQLRRAVIDQFGGGGDTLGGGRNVFGVALVAQAEMAHSLMHEAAMGLRTNNIAAAETAIVEARRIVDETPGLPRWWRAHVAGLYGEILAGLGRPGQAEPELRRSLDIKTGIFGGGWPVASAHMVLGRFQSGEGRARAALDSYRKAFALMHEDTSRRPAIDFETLAPFFSAALAEAAQAPATRAKLDEEMFQAAQMLREGAASQTIQRTSARLASDNPRVGQLVRDLQEATRQRDSLQLDLSGAQARPADQRDQVRETEIKTKLTEAGQRAEALEGEMQAAFPAYAKLTQPRTVTGAEIAALLAPNEALVAFALGDEFSMAFLVRSSGVTAARLAITEAEAGEAVGRLREAFRPQAGQVRPYDLKLAHELWRKLFGPLDRVLAGVDHLVVAPAGPLLSLPPALLVTAAPERANDYVNAAWLGRRLAISLAPSARAFIDLRALKRRPSAPEPFIGFGAPVFAGLPPVSTAGVQPGQRPAPTGLDLLSRQCRTGEPLPPELLRALAPLPETADEVRRVAALLGAGADSVLLGAAVTEPAVRQRRLERYRVIYFATHGLLPGELRCQSEPGLALTPPDTAATRTEEDGLLDASEIATFRLDADLVVLSACNTGGGDGKFGGAALSGLAEAFFYAGARSLLVSHWQVPSVPTVGLMTGLFERLGAATAGASAEALRQAQLALAARPETAHPFFWAAFTLVGDGAAAATKTAALDAGGGEQ
jgi:CHAT domain-containing protein